VPWIVGARRAVGGAGWADRGAATQARRGAWYRATRAERARRRLGRGNWWITTADTLDFATAMLPGLMVERMDELGIDFSVICPTRCLAANSLPEEELRRALCRAYNTMVAEVFRPYCSRLTPAALIPCFSPE